MPAATKSIKPLPAARDLLLQVHRDARDALSYVIQLIELLDRRTSQEADLARHLQDQGIQGQNLAIAMAGKNIGDGVFGGGWAERTSQVQTAIMRIEEYMPVTDADAEQFVAAYRRCITTVDVLEGRVAVLEMMAAHGKRLIQQRTGLKRLIAEIEQRLDPGGTDSARRRARDQRVLELWEANRKTNKWTKLSKEVLQCDPVLRDELGIQVSAEDARNICRPRRRRTRR